MESIGFPGVLAKKNHADGQCCDADYFLRFLSINSKLQTCTWTLMPKRSHDAAFVPASVIQQTYSIHEKTLRVWADNGTLRHVRFQGDEGKRLYHLEHLRALLGDTQTQAEPNTRRRVIYARVSSTHQRPDLERQQSDLQKAFPTHELISEIGSGINFKRKGFTALLDAVLSGLVSEVVVMHRDRLSRFGADLLESIFKSSGTKLLVHGAPDGPPDDARELANVRAA